MKIRSAAYAFLFDKVVLDGLGATQGKLLVVSIGADAISIADGDDGVVVDSLQAWRQDHPVLACRRVSGGLVEIKQLISG